MNAKEAREIEKDHLNHAQKLATGECFNYRCGTAAGYLSAVKDERKRTEPVVEELEKAREALLVQIEASGTCTGGCCNKARSALSSSASVLAEYKKAALGRDEERPEGEP